MLVDYLDVALSF